MAKPRDDRQKDLLRPALEVIIEHGHPLVRLANEIDWDFLDRRFAGVCVPGAGQPGLPTRLVAGPAGRRRAEVFASHGNHGAGACGRAIDRISTKWWYALPAGGCTSGALRQMTLA
jgi:hypothetical protein